MREQFSDWLADWLGVHTRSSADATTWQLESSWTWAPWATLLLVLVMIAWTISMYAREAGNAGRTFRALLAALRLGAYGLLLVMLAQWAIAIWITGPPTMALVIDKSASMGIADRYDDAAFAARLNEELLSNGLTEPTRLNIAKLELQREHNRLLTELTKRYRLVVYTVDADIDRMRNTSTADDAARTVQSLSTNEPSNSSTRIGDALLRVLDDFRGAPPAAVILLSDGVVTQGISLADASQSLRSVGVPFLAIGIGSSKPPRDIELADLLVDDVVFVDDLVSLQVQIKATGLDGQVAKVTLRRDGVATPLVQQSIVLPANGKTLSLQLTDRPTSPGNATYVVEVSPRDDEKNVQNNRQARTVSVRDEKIRVLLADSSPSYEFRFLKTLLERDRTLQLSTYLQDADPDYAAQDKTALPSFPSNREELLRYDVLVIGDVDPRLLPASVWQNVRAFVAEKGGGAVFIAGPKFMPWSYRDNPDVGALLPIKMESFIKPSEHETSATQALSVRPTPLGFRHPSMQLGDTPADTEQIWSKLAPVYWFASIPGLKPGSQVLAEVAGKPVICFQYFGAGRVLFQAIDSTWRWRSGFGETYFLRYWLQTIRFLAHGKFGKGRGVELTADRREYRQGEIAQLRARFLDLQVAPADSDVVVILNAPGEARRRIQLHRNPAVAGTYEAALPDLMEGQYEVLMTEPRTSGNPPVVRFSVVAPPGEFARTQMDAEALAAAADATRGKFYTADSAKQLLNDLPVGRRMPIENHPPIAIWNRWWLLAAFLSCLTCEWILRKRKGML
jgi:hypothetical protein